MRRRTAGPECVGRRDETITGHPAGGRKGHGLFGGRPGGGRNIALDTAQGRRFHVRGDGTQGRPDRSVLLERRGPHPDRGRLDYRTEKTPLKSWGTTLGWAAGLFPGGLAALCALDGLFVGALVDTWVPIFPTTIDTAVRAAGITYAVAFLVALCVWPFLARQERR